MKRGFWVIEGGKLHWRGIRRLLFQLRCLCV